MTEIRSQEVIRAEIAANNAEIQELQRLNALLEQELADNHPLGWVVITELDMKGNPKAETVIHRINHDELTIESTEYWILRLNVLHPLQQKVQLRATRGWDETFDWENVLSIGFGETMRYEVGSWRPDSQALFSIGFYSTHKEAEAAQQAPISTETFVGWAVVAEYDADGVLSLGSKIYEVSALLRVIKNTEQEPCLRLRTIVTPEGTTLEASAFPTRDHTQPNIGSITLGKAMIHTVGDAHNPPMTKFYLSFHLTRAEAEAATRVTSFPPLT